MVEGRALDPTAKQHPPFLSTSFPLTKVGSEAWPLFSQSANKTPSDSPHKTAASRGSSGAVLFHDRINLSSQFRRELSSLMHLQEAMPISAGGGHVLPFRPTTYSAALICRFSSSSKPESRLKVDALRRNSTNLQKIFSQKQNSDNNKNKTDHD